MDKIYRGYGRCYGGGCDAMGMLRGVSRGEVVEGGRVMRGICKFFEVCDKVGRGRMVEDLRVWGCFFYGVSSFILMMGMFYVTLTELRGETDASRRVFLEYSERVWRVIVRVCTVGYVMCLVCLVLSCYLKNRS